MTSSNGTNITSLLRTGIHASSRVSDGNLVLFVDDNGSDTYVAPDQLVFLRGVLAIQNQRLFKTGAVARQFTKRLSTSELFEDVSDAFGQPDVVRLYSGRGMQLERQIDLMSRVTAVASEHAGIMMLLGLMKERLGGHYYHGLRAGIAFCSLCEVFDPNNELPLKTKLLAGIIHDAGKLKVPRDILLKPDKLTREEKAIMTAHDVATEHILTPFNGTFPHLSHVAANHHLSSKVNKSDNPAVENAGVLLRIADIYDALGSRRDYKAPFASSEVRRIMLREDYFPHHPEVVSYLLNSFPCPDEG